jgi:outer membrane lipoprotein-sorting protein
VICPPWMLTEPDRLRMVLAHEVAHVRRKDLLWMWLPALAGTLFFFHPLVWLARREATLDLESACDAEAVLTTEARPDRYAEALVQVVLCGKAWPRAEMGALSAADSAGLLKRRLGAMHAIRRPSRRARVGAAALVLLAGLAMLPCRLVSGAPEAPAAGELPATPSTEVTRLLDRAKEKLKAASLTADLEVQYGAGALITWKASLLKPGYARMELVLPNGGPGQILLSDGEQYFHIDPETREYDAVPNTRRELRPVSSPLLEPFLTSSSPLVGPRMRYAGTQKVEGVEYDVIDYSFGLGTGGGRVFFAKDGLPTGWEQWAEGRAAESFTREWLRNVRSDAGLKPEAFRFEPGGYRRVERPVVPPQPG